MIKWDKYNTIVIVGLPATGKSWLADRVPFSHKVYRTDDYMYHDWEDALYALMADIKRGPAKQVIEGVQGYRLLRKLAQLNMKGPDLVIRCIATKELRQRRYMDRGKNLSANFDSTLQKIWVDYVRELQHNRVKPECFIYDTLEARVVQLDNLTI